MTRLAAILMMAPLLGGTLGGCGPGSGGDNPPQLWLAMGSDELHAKLAPVEPPHY